MARFHPDTLLLWQDECWFSRFAQPHVQDWDGLHLQQREPAHNETHKALACYGAVRQDTGQMHLAFCPGQPNSRYTVQFLSQLLRVARAEQKRLLIVIWDHASWHKSSPVRSWIREHNQQAKQNDDVRLLAWLLPKKAPWLNPIEPHWLHGKRAVLEPGADDLTVESLRNRLCAYYQSGPNDLNSNYHC